MRRWSEPDCCLPLKPSVSAASVRLRDISLLNGDYVGALFVREDCQGKGIGLRLLEYVRRRRPRLSLHAYVRNAGALCFYRRCGFKIVAESVNEQTQEPEVLLVWSRGCLSGCRNRFPGDS